MWYDMSIFVVGKQIKHCFCREYSHPFWARNLILPFAKTLKGLLWHTYRHEHVYFWSRVAKLRLWRNFVFTWKQFSIWSISKSQICTAEGHHGRRRSLKVTTKVSLRKLRYIKGDFFLLLTLDPYSSSLLFLYLDISLTSHSTQAKYGTKKGTKCITRHKTISSIARGVLTSSFGSNVLKGLMKVKRVPSSHRTINQISTDCIKTNESKKSPRHSHTLQSNQDRLYPKQFQHT